MDKLPPGPRRLGTRWREVLRLAPLVHRKVHSTVIALEADARLVIEFRQRGFTGSLAYPLRPDGAGTVLRQQQTLHPRPLMRPFAGVVRELFGPRLTSRLNDIKAVAGGLTLSVKWIEPGRRE